MKNKLLIIQHVAHEGAGRFLQTINQSGIEYRTILSDDHTVWPDAQDCSALLVMGGPDSANDQNKKITSELQFIKSFLQTGRPYLGICLGMQLLAHAAGACVEKYQHKEIGFGMEGLDFSAEITDSTDAVFGGIKLLKPYFHLHGETVVPAGEVIQIGEGNFCPCQVIRYRSHAWGIQGHIELTKEMLALWCRMDLDLVKEDADALILRFSREEMHLLSQADRVCKRFLSLI